MRERAKFWSDDFDMDLLKVFPDIEATLGATIDVPVWTVGHEWEGRRNHPCVWNSHGAYLWLAKPNLPRDKHGWFNISGCVDDAPEIECTWLEILRDQWPHSYGMVMVPTGERFAEPPKVAFDRIMYDMRGWHKYEDIDARRADVLKWLIRSNCKFAEAVERYRLGREEFPYFAAGSVPGFSRIASDPATARGAK